MEVRNLNLGKGRLENVNAARQAVMARDASQRGVDSVRRGFISPSYSLLC